MEVRQGWQYPLCRRINSPDVKSCDCAVWRPMTNGKEFIS
jgi:hypothetical protein